MSKSGGVTARNTREGFRSEYIAKFIFSSFGTATQINQENDIGIDLICNLATFEGQYLKVKSSYGVQVKSEGAEFIYSGKQATTWLSNLEYPLLLAEVSKKEARIKIYSACNLNRFLLSLNSDNEVDFPDSIHFIQSNDDELKEPDKVTGKIPIGKPILDFYFDEIDDIANKETYLKILSEWLDFDNKNYLLRRAGVACAYVYTKWETNRSLDASQRVWYKPYFYSLHHTMKTKKLIAEALIPIGLYVKSCFISTGDNASKNEFNQIRDFAVNHLFGEMDNHGKEEVFKEAI